MIEYIFKMGHLLIMRESFLIHLFFISVSTVEPFQRGTSSNYGQVSAPVTTTTSTASAASQGGGGNAFKMAVAAAGKNNKVVFPFLRQAFVTTT